MRISVLTAAVSTALLLATSAHAEQAPAAVVAYGPPIALQQAKQAAAAAQAEAQRRNLKVSVVIVDPSGEVVYVERGDGTQYASVDLAEAKARAAARYRRATTVFQDQLKSGNVLSLSLPGAFPAGGGVPLVVDKRIVGAIGESGGPDDGSIATAGANALK